MAAPISPVSIAAPVELTAPQATSVSVTSQQKGAFKSELNNASNNASNHAQGKKQAAQSASEQSSVSEKNVENSKAKQLSSSDSVASKNSAASREQDTNSVSSGDAQSADKLDNASALKAQQSSDNNHNVVGPGVNQDGQALPSSGETLPQNFTIVDGQIINLDLVNENLNTNPELAAQSVIAQTVNTQISQNPVPVIVDQVPVIQEVVSQSTQTANNPQAVDQNIGNQAGSDSNLIDKTLANSTPFAQQPVSPTVKDTNIAVSNNVPVVEAVVQSSDLSSSNLNSAKVAQTEVAAETRPVATNAGQGPLLPQQVVSESNQPVKTDIDQTSTSSSPVNVAASVKGQSVEPVGNGSGDVVAEQISSTVKTSGSVILNDRPVADTAVPKTDVGSNQATELKVDNQTAPITVPASNAQANEMAARADVAVSAAVNVVDKQSKDAKVSNVDLATAANLKSDGGSTEKTTVNDISANSQNIDSKKPVLSAGQPLNNAAAFSPTQQAGNEQSVSLNQTLDKMRAGVEAAMAPQDEAPELKATTSKSATAAEVVQQLSNLQTNLRTTSPVQMQMPPNTPPTAKNWGKAVADKVFIAASQNLRVANIQLDPPELGALQIRLQLTGVDQQMNVSFTSPHASVRDVLEQQLPRLREMLEEQGINLGESSVNDQNKQGGRDSEPSQLANSAGYVDHSDGDSMMNPLNTQGTLALVDFYA